MSLSEIIDKAKTLTADERKELMAVLAEAERQDKEKQPPPETDEKFVSFAEAAAHLIGSVSSGIGDLSTNKKYMEDFGRD